MAGAIDPPDVASAAAVCRRNAVHVLRLAWTTRPDVGFDRPGVLWLDEYVTRAAELLDAELLDAELLDEFVQLMGCFYGECLIAEFSGSWGWSAGSLGVRTEGLGFTYPFNAVARQLRLGPQGSLAVGFLTAVEYLRVGARVQNRGDCQVPAAQMQATNNNAMAAAVTRSGFT